MLENKILSNQSVNDSKREAVTTKSNQNTTDRKFEDAMNQSRQEQLNAEQRQNAARNDQAQQQQRQQQELVKSRQDAERNSQPTNQTKNTKADDKPAIKDDEEQLNSSATKNNSVESDSVKASSTDNSLSEKNSKETEVDSISWLDTLMKIVGHNQQSSEQESGQTENELGTEQVTQNTAQASNDTMDKEVTDTSKISDVLTNFLFGNKASTSDDAVSDSIDSTETSAEGDTKASDITKLFTDTAIKEVNKDSASSNTETSELDGQNSAQQDIISSLLGKGDESSTNDDLESSSTNIDDEASDSIINSGVVNVLGTDVNKSQDVDNHSEVSDEDITASQKGSPVFTSSALQQQIQQEQNIDNIKQPSILEQSTKASTVLNFANPALAEVNKYQKTDGIDANQYSSDVDDELDGVKANAESVSKSEHKLDPELRSLLEMRSASLLANGIDTNTKTAAPDTKTDVVDINGVQLDKAFQLPKLEHASQAKHEVLLRENILFNKQEMATHMQQQIGIMMSKNMKSIDIRLDPPELGAMQIKLTMNNDQAAVSFVVSNQQAKDALEASLPKLRELLEQQGMELAESDVQHGNAQGDAGTQDDSSGGHNGTGVSNEDGQDDANMIAQEKLNRAINSPWNVDYYA